MRSGVQPGGKQCPDYASRRCHYTRTTGIWQTVWLEAVRPIGLQDVQIVPDLDGSRFVVMPRFYAAERGLRFRATLAGRTERRQPGRDPAGERRALRAAASRAPRPGRPTIPSSTT